MKTLRLLHRGRRASLHRGRGNRPASFVLIGEPILQPQDRPFNILPRQRRDDEANPDRRRLAPERLAAEADAAVDVARDHDDEEVVEIQPVADRAEPSGASAAGGPPASGCPEWITTRPITPSQSVLNARTTRPVQGGKASVAAMPTKVASATRIAAETTVAAASPTRRARDEAAESLAPGHHGREQAAEGEAVGPRAEQGDRVAARSQVERAGDRREAQQPRPAARLRPASRIKAGQTR